MKKTNTALNFNIECKKTMTPGFLPVNLNDNAGRIDLTLYRE